MSVVIETTIGDITVDLYLKERPNTCLNFLKLCKMKYYNLCLFYKIEKNFIAQTGDPTATGRGGESVFCHLYGDQAKYFDVESKPRLKHEKLGTLSMVNNGNNMNGSQFFLTLNENLTYLDEDHSVFGEVAEGFDILQKLNDAICDTNNRPYQDIRITHTVILHDPFEDPKGLAIPDASPEPTKEMLESNYIGADEKIDDDEGKTAEEIEEKIKESEAKARATILEMVGDIPDAEVKPPENVLFVCKLNPVTTSEDLEIIFSRFGKILSCEVIKDKKTGDSLQYAFIEFEEEKSCEDAFFKMNNVLIDDRRIRVDWSQSTSKLGRANNAKVKSNFSLKQTGRNDDYDLIFDVEDVPVNNKQMEGKHYKSRSDDTRREHKKYNQKDYEKRYKDGDWFEQSKESRSDAYNKSKIKYSEMSSSRNYRETDRYHSKSESSSRRHKRSEKRDKSMSPEYRKKVPQSSDSRHYKETDKKHRYDSPSSEYGKESRESFSKHDKESKKKPSYDSKKITESFSKYDKESKRRSRYDSKSPEQPKKTVESFSKGLEAQRKNASVSPDRKKNSYSRYRNELPDHFSRTKYSSNKYDHHEYSRSKSLRDTEKTKSDSMSNKYKSDMPRKKPLLEKSKKSKRKSPVSSSSSSSDSDSSSSSPSSSDSDYKEKHRKQKQVSSSHKKSKSHKKRKL